MKYFDDHSGHSYAPNADPRLRLPESTAPADGAVGGGEAAAGAAGVDAGTQAQLDGISHTLQEGMQAGDPMGVVGNIGALIWPPGPAVILIALALVALMVWKAAKKRRQEKRAEQLAAQQAEAERQAHLARQKDFAEMRRQRAERQKAAGAAA
ncbi:hypothetical protein ACXN5S_09035 [Pseudoroseicyclus sp. H15]